MSDNSSNKNGSLQKGFFKRMLSSEQSKSAKQAEVKQMDVKQRHPAFTVSNNTVVTPGRTVKPQEVIISPAVRQLNREGYVVYNSPEKQDVYVTIQPESAFFDDEEPKMVRMAGGSFVSAGKRAGHVDVPIRSEAEPEPVIYTQPADIFSNACRRDKLEEIDFNEVIIKKNDSFEAEIKDAPALFKPNYQEVYEPVVEESFKAVVKEAVVTSSAGAVAKEPAMSFAGYREEPEYELQDIPAIIKIEEPKVSFAGYREEPEYEIQESPLEAEKEDHGEIQDVLAEMKTEEPEYNIQDITIKTTAEESECDIQDIIAEAKTEEPEHDIQDITVEVKTEEPELELQEIPVEAKAEEPECDIQDITVEVKTEEPELELQEIPVEVKTEEPEYEIQEIPVEVKIEEPECDTQEVPVEVKIEEPEFELEEAHAEVKIEEPECDTQEIPVEAKIEEPELVLEEVPVEVKAEEPIYEVQEAPVEEALITEVPAGLYVDAHKPIDFAKADDKEESGPPSFVGVMSMETEIAVTSEAAPTAEVMLLQSTDILSIPAPEETGPTAETVCETVAEKCSETVSDVPAQVEIFDEVADIMKITIPSLRMSDGLIRDLSQGWERIIPDDGLEVYDCIFRPMKAPIKADSAPCAAPSVSGGRKSSAKPDPYGIFRVD
ncbi:MAG: hypothetical protein LBG63_05060 [Candidatus Methanoplasma sp.]|nr:hypothetical protein [Candidatus Methanoplasma sp.]